MKSISLRKSVGSLASIVMILALPATARAHNVSSPFHQAAMPSSTTSGFTAVLFRGRRGWVAAKDGILATTNGGVRWTRQRAGARYILGFDFVNGKTGWALPATSLGPLAVPQASQGLVGTTDGGRHWRRLSADRFLGLDFLRPRFGWGIQYRVPRSSSLATPAPQGQLVLTHNGGRTWHHRTASPAAQSVCFNSESQGWLADRSSVFVTTNRGLTWKRAFRARLTGPPGWFATIHCARDSVWVLFAAANSGASDQEPYIAYRRGRHGWRAVFEEGYFGSASYPHGSGRQGPGNYVGPFVVPTAGSAFFSGYDYGANHIRGQGYDGAEVLATSSRTGWRRSLIAQLDPDKPIALSFVSRRKGWIVGTRSLSCLHRVGKTKCRPVGAATGEVLTTGNGGFSWEKVLP